MNDNRYLLPALSAITLAVLFPAYWIGQLFLIGYDNGEPLYDDVSGLNLADLAFLLIGLLMLHVYLSLKRFLNERHAFTSANIPLFLIMISASVYIFGSLAMDTFMHFFGDELHLPWHKAALDGNTTALLVSTVVFGALDITLGIVLFTRAREFSSLLVAFAILTIIQGIFEVTLIFSPASFVIYPIALILLAILFLRQPETLEIV